jgi:hypothetical protein
MKPKRATLSPGHWEPNKGGSTEVLCGERNYLDVLSDLHCILNFEALS